LIEEQNRTKEAFMVEEMYQKLAQAVIDGESEDAEALAREALEQGLDPLGCITQGLTKGIQEVGKLFADGEYYLPELIMGADAMKQALEVSLISVSINRRMNS
jgi:methanogenic corrinoid protein MtbC1